jgi:hypothetical protein
LYQKLLITFHTKMEHFDNLGKTSFGAYSFKNKKGARDEFC